MADIDKLFEQISSEVLTEEVKLQMAVLFENALQEAIAEKEKKLEESNIKEVNDFKENLTTQIDEYLTYFSEEFVKTNSNVIEDSVKVKTAERVLKTFSGIMKDFSVQLDEKKVDADVKIHESREEINKLTKQLIEAKKQVKTAEKTVMVVEASTKLTTDLQKSKLVEYAKGLPVDELFEKKVNAYVSTILVEKKAAAPAPEQIIIKEEKEIVIEKPVSTVDQYLDRM
jgi:hypothetical protein